MIIKQLAALAVLAQLQVARPQLWSPIHTGAENIAPIATTWNGIITIAGAGKEAVWLKSFPSPRASLPAVGATGNSMA